MSRYDELKARETASVMNTYGRYPLAFERAQGSRLYDLDGREYVDLLSGIAVTSLGHCHPGVTKAITDQASRMVHISNLFTQPRQIELAEKLLATNGLGKVFFCNSGAEANEGAIKLARRYMREVKKREAYEILTLSGSFHGRTLATLTATGQDKIKHGFAPLPEGFVTVPRGDIAAMAQAIKEKTAGVLIEVIQGEGGVLPLGQEYLDGLAALCRERDVLLMIDEVQTGMGRTGKYWGYQHYGLAPDIVTSSKALANGLPMGAVMATDEVAKGFVPGSHATTFGGGALVSAAACATLDVMREEKICERAARMGDFAKGLFEELREAHPDKIAEIRGLGLIIGVALTFPGAPVWKALLDKGFVLNLTQDTVLRLLPALTIEQEDLKRFAAALDEILAATPLP